MTYELRTDIPPGKANKSTEFLSAVKGDSEPCGLKQCWDRWVTDPTRVMSWRNI